MSFTRRSIAVFQKDLALELRSRDILMGAFVFSLLTVLVMSFAVDPTQGGRTSVVAGLVWVTLLFSSGITLGKGIALERENGCLEMLLTIPGDRAAIFIGKAAANVVFIVITAALVVPVFGVLFRVDLWERIPALALVVVLGALAIAGPGTLVGTMVLETRAREMLLPILLFPLEIPALIGCVETTGTILQGDPVADAALWIKLLLAFDLVFLATSAALYDRLMES